MFHYYSGLMSINFFKCIKRVLKKKEKKEEHIMNIEN